MTCLPCLFLMVLGDEITLVDWRHIQEEVAPVLDDCEGPLSDLLCAEQSQEGQAKLCDCEENCEEYGDCCLDYEYADHRNTNIGSRWMCAGTKVGGLRVQHYYMVGKCPHGYIEKSTVAKCLKQVVAADIPVSSRRTGKVCHL